ncbi:2-nonaprenyl-3-methyl-6-methoxy-1,4-benzoquinol hydroxylase [Arenicella chitinivorans]|uniref:3-demethoxyubiquinol 3-hydroxylase n=1 Tax=Arenicella chitinivorans TaxID=1329800 RepID=A0A918RPM8_9GAMM|nr:2-polyprenyl-3-methyl-6-methoxy-1,4-benzoquinone monooxygenase [Arenicella chitinivorans]GHA07396.1 2-nonaprenyl-3-methyl-6-methoxy-1,4-benzoquinol hydroxylase [Arenicella chitinivorans]
MQHRPRDFIDQLFSHLDQGLRNTFTKPKSSRPSPATKQDIDPIADDDYLKRYSASLMRVNHVGEVCAQALYQGQALTSRSPSVKIKMHEAAEEEIDHLNWCFERIEQLDGRTSYLNPLWYLGSLTIGIGAGIAGDKWSLGFLAETEHQVVAHLQSHLKRLPEEDVVSRAIVQQMVIDEAEHAAMAEDNGAQALPPLIKSLMRASAKVMTTMSEKI